MENRAPRLAALLLCWILLSVPSAALATEFCRCDQTSFTWGGCDTEGTCDAGAWTGCTPSPDDGFRIAAGCHVTVDAGSDVLLDQGLTRRLAVSSGGRLTIRGPGELRLGPLGLEAASGSTVEFTGCFRQGGGLARPR